MKFFITLIASIFMLPLCCIGSTAIYQYKNKTTYVIEESLSNPDLLNVSVSRVDASSPTQLILRGKTMGVPSQVRRVMCDRKFVKEEKSGTWNIPANCQHITWQVRLLSSGEGLASEQQSIKYKNFILFSELSSLPRLQNATEESVKISITNAACVFPARNAIGEINLSNTQTAPLFILINPNQVENYSSDNINITYFIDNINNSHLLPDMISHKNGIKWLKEITHHQSNESFNIAWLGVTSSKMSLAGATGDRILLANYPIDGDIPFGKMMLLYVALHEAFHQLDAGNTMQPSWVSESLASYYGVKALLVSLPGNKDALTLKDRFISGASQFKDGLITINRKVVEGDRSEYGAFYTKGIAFWMAVDSALQRKNDNLDNHLYDVLQASYDEQGAPINLAEILKLPSNSWAELCRDFLN